MTLQPPGEWNAEPSEPETQPDATTAEPVQVPNRTDSTSTGSIGERFAEKGVSITPAHTPRESSEPSLLQPPPFGLEVVGGSQVDLRRAVALDRLASNVGYLTIEWSLRHRHYDLLALEEGSSVVARDGDTRLYIEVAQPMKRVLIATGTQGTMQLPPSQLRITNGTTVINVQISGGTSLGVWPRVTLTRVGDHIVVRNEDDPLSGILGVVANAYGYDERNFSLAHTL